MRPVRCPRGLVEKVAVLLDPEGLDDEGRLGRVEDLPDLRFGPLVELPLLAFAVGILGAEEAASRGLQVPQHVGEDLSCRLGVERLARRLEGLQEGHGEHGLVVEHLLEVGQPPARIGGVAVKPVAELIVDAAAGAWPRGSFRPSRGPSARRCASSSAEERGSDAARGTWGPHRILRWTCRIAPQALHRPRGRPSCPEGRPPTTRRRPSAGPSVTCSADESTSPCRVFQTRWTPWMSSIIPMRPCRFSFGM